MDSLGTEKTELGRVVGVEEYWGATLERCISQKPVGFVDLRTAEARPTPGHRVGQGYSSVGSPAAAAPPVRPRGQAAFLQQGGE